MAEELKQRLGQFILYSVLGLLGLIGFGLVFETFAPDPRTSDTSGSGFLMVLGGAVNFVAEIAAQAGWVILPVAVVWLLIRGLNALAVYIGTTAIGAAVLIGAGIFLTSSGLEAAGARPGEGTVFTTGSVQLAVTCGALLLVFLPAIPTKARTWAIAGTTTAAATFETIRIVTGAVSLWPVLGGWMIGLCWLGVTAWAFSRWRRPSVPWSGFRSGLPVEDAGALMPVPVGERLLPGGRHGILALAGVWVLLAVVVSVMGLLITEMLPSVQSIDQAVVQWFAGNRIDTWNALATIAGSFGTTGGIIGVLIVTGSLSLAITRRSAPAMFLVTAVVGETALYLITGVIVGRARPDVDHLSEGVPPTSSFPSGHVAAALVLYGGLALLLRSWTQSRLRDLGFILAPLIVLGVLLSRLYWGVHFPTDTIASLLFATVWIWVCWREFRPARGSPVGSTRPVSEETAEASEDRS